VKQQNDKRHLWFIGLILWLVACTEGAITDENVLFHDEFAAGQTGAWVLEGDAVGRTSILEEQLLIEIHDPRTLQFATLEDPISADAGAVLRPYGACLELVYKCIDLIPENRPARAEAGQLRAALAPANARRVRPLAQPPGAQAKGQVFAQIIAPAE
jgi:hypothetical protein